MDKIKSIIIVLPKADLVLSSIVGTYKLMLEAVKESQGQTQVQITGYKRKHMFFDDLFQVKLHKTFEQTGPNDLVIVPAIKSDIVEAIEKNSKLIIITLLII